MIVLLEGPDCAGKTTLAKRIETDFGFPYVHVGKPERNPFQHHYLPAMQMDEGVLDRLHWSSDAYSFVTRGGYELSDRQFGFIDGILHAKNTVITLCLPPLQAVLDKLGERPNDEHHGLKTATEIWQYFQHHTYRTTLPVIDYDYTIDGAMDRLMADLQEYRAIG